MNANDIAQTLIEKGLDFKSSYPELDDTQKQHVLDAVKAHDRFTGDKPSHTDGLRYYNYLRKALHPQQRRGDHPPSDDLLRTIIRAAHLQPTDVLEAIREGVRLAHLDFMRSSAQPDTPLN